MSKEIDKIFADITALSDLENNINRISNTSSIVNDAVNINAVRERIKELFTDLLVEMSGPEFEDVKVLVERRGDKINEISISVGNNRYDLTHSNIEIMKGVIESVKPELESVTFMLSHYPITAYWMK